MDLADLDRALDHLRRATERAGANLLELDQSSSRALLAAARLEGLSAERWAEAEEALAGLFQSYTALSGVADAAVVARGTGSFVSASRRAQVEQLVLGPSVELPERAVPMAERDLVSGSRVLHRCTPDELLASMAQPFALARSVIVTAAETWETGGPLVQSVRARLVDASEDGDLGGGPGGRAELERRLDTLEHRLLTDPLAFDAAAVEALGAEVDGVVATADGARRVRDEFEAELAAAQSRLAELGRSTADVLRAHEDAGARVVDVPPPPTIPCEALDGELHRVAALAADGDWVSVQAELAGWSRRVDQHRHDVDQHRKELDDLLEQRRQLRGRLDAYTAKSAALGCVEDEVLEELRRQAEGLLYQAPIDLVRAEAGLRRYQEALDTVLGQRSERAR